uniref:Uncharacterized protein n=1 Tax=Arundo donax TaxID=35708 RepID=A0A0A9AM39_ARUDO
MLSISYSMVRKSYSERSFVLPNSKIYHVFQCMQRLPVD